MTKYKNLCGANRPVPYLPKRFSIDKLYVESGAKFLEESQLGNKEKWTCLESSQSILIDPRVKSKRRIVEGEPGFGKSTFALQIAHDWVNNHESMKDIEILILLRLRQYKNVSSVYSAIKRCLLPKESKLSEEDIEEILQAFKSSTMVILDGYDEFPDRKKDTDIDLIIKGDMFPDCVVILTSRVCPAEYSSDTQRIKLTGFDDTARDAYMKKAVVGGDTQAAESIKEFFAENPVSKYICHVPLFFVMVAHMAHWYKQFRNIKNVTKFFEKIVACLLSHEQIRETGTGKLEENQQCGKSHSKLNEIAYEGILIGLRPDQQIIWRKDQLCKRLGQALYKDYVRTGILVEEEIFDFDSCATKTEVSFCHKLFHEWFAAQFIAEELAADVTFEPWHSAPVTPFSFREGQHFQPIIYWQPKSLLSVHPCFVQYMYQFACGLNSAAAVKIIEHISKEAATEEYMLLCIKEWGGNLENIRNTVISICSRDIYINDSHSILYEESAIEVLKFASRKEIPISKLVLADCLDFSVQSSGLLHLKRSNLPVPIVTLYELQIFAVGVEISEEQTDIILKYSSMCQGLKVLKLHHCLLPRYIKVPGSFRSREVTVLWLPGKFYTLNLESGEWEEKECMVKVIRGTDDESKAAVDAHASRVAPMSDKDYEGAGKAVGLQAKYKKTTQRRV